MTLDSLIYVLDTHALYWYWTEPHRLGDGALEIFRAFERRQASGLVPLIVLAEIHYLTSRLGTVLGVDRLLNLIDRAPALHLESLTRQHLLAFGRLEGIPEMHDRLIAAVALVHNAPVISRDNVLREHPIIRTIW